MADKENSVLDAMLEDDQIEVRYREENEILKPLLTEIGLIEDQHIANFVRSILLKADIFWEIPSSFSGNYHPPDESGLGGNVLHTKRVVRVAWLMCDSYGPSLNTMLEYNVSLTRDMVIAACLIHDVTKGKVWAEGMEPRYDRFHPYTIDDFINKNVRSQDMMAGEEQSSMFYLDEEIQQIILSWVHSHLGVWSPIPETFPNSIPSMIVHLADNIASHMHLLVDGDEVQDWRWE